MTALAIRKPESAEELQFCARTMASSEPWLTLRRDEAQALQLLSNPAKEVYVALQENEIAGFLILDLNGAFRGYLQTVCVMPRWRKHGIGSRLIAFAEERIFREHPNVFMCVSSFNTGAQRLYSRLGYEVVGVLKDYVVAGYDEILLRKSLAPLDQFTPKPREVVR